MTSADAVSNLPPLQAEEARFLEDMPAVLGPRGMAGLEAIQCRVFGSSRLTMSVVE